MKTLYLFPAVLALGIGQALAQSPLDLHHAASPRARVSVSNVKGEVTVLGWDRNEVAVTGRLGEGAAPLAIEGDNDSLRIEVKPRHDGGWFNWKGDSGMGPTQLEVHVPRGASLNAEVVSATLGIDGLDGGDIDVDAVSGRVRINAQTPKLSVDSVSGSLELSGRAERADLQTVSGDILAPVLGADADLETVSGQIRAQGGPWRKLTLSTVSGDVRLGGGLAPGGSIDIDSMSGDVDLQIPPTLSARIDASSFSGDVRSDFGEVSEHDHGPGSELKTTAGKGDGRIHAETFSGDLRIRKQNP